MPEGTLRAILRQAGMTPEEICKRLQASGLPNLWIPGPDSFLEMFSYSGLNPTQMRRLRDEFGVYGLDSGRICVAALNHANLDRVVAAIAQVV